MNLTEVCTVKEKPNNRSLLDKPFSTLDSHWRYYRSLKILRNLLYKWEHLWGKACRSLEGLLSAWKPL